MAARPSIIYTSSEVPVLRRGTKHSAGLDLFAHVDLILEPQCVSLIGSGIKIKWPTAPATKNKYYGQLATKSSVVLQKYCQVVGGVIDPDYVGEVKVLMHNFGKRAMIRKGEAYAQLLFLPFVGDVGNTYASDKVRGEGGLGSTAGPVDEVDLTVVQVDEVSCICCVPK